MIIGVVGGMGSYATLHFFKRYLEIFPAEREWERPRIIIDNRCTMPSRVRAVIYNEKYDEVVKELADSIGHLLDAGCDYIILACGTSHIFLEEVYKRIPGAKKNVLNIIETCAKYISDNKPEGEFSLLATEGSIQSGIYQNVFSKYDLNIIRPHDEALITFRKYIEAVKTNKIDDEILDSFIDLLNGQESNQIILGCTEFPVLYGMAAKEKINDNITIFDPLEIALNKLHDIYITGI